MAKSNSPQLLLFFLLVAALGSQGHLKIKFKVSKEALNWTEARHYCQDRHTDMASVSVASPPKMFRQLVDSYKNVPTWVGLHRDPGADQVWKWISLRTPEGLTGSDFSTDKKWYPGDQDPHCVAVGDHGQAWHSQPCSAQNLFYCSSPNNIVLMESATSWDQAEKLCQDQSMTLATVTSENSAGFNRSGWIGLRREGGHTWKWSDGSPVGYTNWAEGEPRTWDCVTLHYTDLQWESHLCSQHFHALCFQDNLLVVKLNKTWEEALAYCRELEMDCTNDPCVPSYDLLTSTGHADNIYISDKIYREGTTDEVWVGPRFLAGEWLGLDGEPMSGEATLPVCPSLRERCLTVPKNNYKTWLLRDCSERRNFICYPT